ncbi:MAG: gliding motility-associated C-terminal domain-containing protein [Bacteroidota bacterium]
MKIRLLLTFLLCGVLLNAQEICDNSIDDDGDGLTDLQDPDCICEESTSTITANFEDNSCCPTTLTLFGPGLGYSGDGYYCVRDDWDFASRATPDYYNEACGYLGFSFNPRVPLPIPSGNGVVGMATRKAPDTNEGIARCLDCTLIAGQSYSVKFFAGFDSSDDFLSSPTEFAIYGKQNCSNIPNTNDNSTGCLENIGWIELGTFAAVGSEGEWVEVTGTFTAPFDVAALAFSKSCDWVAGPGHIGSFEYHFMDALEIDGPLAGPNCGNFISEVSAELSGDCGSGYTLAASPADGVIYQWYLDGVAIAGADINPWPLNPQVVGDYQVRVTFADGNCAISDPISFDPSEGGISLEGIVTEPACFGDVSGSIELLINSSAAPFEVEWNTGSSASVLTNLGAGTYSVSVTDANACSGVLSTSIDQPEPLIVTVEVAQPSVTEGGTITLFPTGGTSPYSYTWSNGLSAQSGSDLPPGMYTITITDDNGCTEQVTLELLEPLQLELEVLPESCAGDCSGAVEAIVVGGSSPYTFEWDIPGETNSQMNLCAGFYSLTVTDVQGSTLTETIEIGALAGFDLFIQETEVRCSDDETTALAVTVDGGGVAPFSYAWSTGASGPEIIGVGTGAYELTVTDAEGCDQQQTYIVEAYQPQVVNFTTAATNCARDEFQLALESPLPTGLTYFLNDEAVGIGSNGILAGLAAGSYLFSYEDINGCAEPIAEFSLLEGQPYDLFVDESTRNVTYGEELRLGIQLAPVAQLFPGSEITWSLLNTFECLTAVEEECTEILLNPTESEVVRLRFRDELGCEQTFSISIFVELPDQYIYVPNVFSPNGDGSNDKFSFFVTDFVRAVRQVQIFNRWGALVFEQNGQQPGGLPFWDGRFSGQPVDPGVYVYTIQLALETGEEVVISGDVLLVR